MKQQTSWQPFIGPEPACGISMGVAIKAIRDWTNMSHERYWKSLTGLTREWSDPTYRNLP
jgi:hypothetical protein